MDYTRLFPGLPRGPRLWALVFGIATAVGLFFTLFNYGATSLVSEASPFVRHLGPIADWWLWALLIPPVVWLSRRFPIDSSRPLSGIALHVGLGLAVAAAELGAFGFLSQFYYGTILTSAEMLPLGTRYTLLLANWLPTAFMMYWIMAADRAGSRAGRTGGTVSACVTPPIACATCTGRSTHSKSPKRPAVARTYGSRFRGTPSGAP